MRVTTEGNGNDLYLRPVNGGQVRVVSTGSTDVYSTKDAHKTLIIGNYAKDEQGK